MKPPLLSLYGRTPFGGSAIRLFLRASILCVAKPVNYGNDGRLHRADVAIGCSSLTAQFATEGGIVVQARPDGLTQLYLKFC
jgi:hypothetical protein